MVSPKRQISFPPKRSTNIPICLLRVGPIRRRRANLNAQAIGSSSAFGVSVEDFFSLPKDALSWLDRNLETAVEIGAIDQTMVAMKESLDRSCHKLGQDLLGALSVMASDPKFPVMWDYIKGARQHGNEAFDKAKGSFVRQADAGAISHEVSKAAATLLTFMQAAA